MEAAIPSSWIIFLLILLLLLVIEGKEAMGIRKNLWETLMEPDEMNNHVELHEHENMRNRLNNDGDKKSMHAEEDHKVFDKISAIQMVVDDGKNDIHLSPHDHTDHRLIVFFTIKDLKVGKTLPIYFPKRDPSSSPPLLPKERADSIPFSSKALPHILSLFNTSQNSPTAIAVGDTLRQCELKPINGETKTCATSFESLMEFVGGAFGTETNFRALRTTHITKSNTHFQNYTILENPREVEAEKMVACHTMPYPYTVFYCHYQESETKVFSIPLVGENGDMVDAIAICHLDTSQWGPNHPSFRLLKVERGTIPICHFFPSDHLVWVPVM